MLTKLDIEKYFSAIKNESVLLMALGIAAVVAAAVCWIWMKPAVYKGAAIPLMLFGLFLIITNYTTYKQCDELRKRNVYAFDLNPSDLKAKEVPRMESAVKALQLARYVSLALLLTGIAIWVYCQAAPERSMGKGIGMSLVLLVIVYLAANSIAVKRGEQYIAGLQQVKGN